jgi:hypothetical protein
MPYRGMAISSPDFDIFPLVWVRSPTCRHGEMGRLLLPFFGDFANLSTSRRALVLEVLIGRYILRGCPKYPPPIIETN